jgi:uncharacterized membrane protein YobD (UPF0266 family)
MNQEDLAEPPVGAEEVNRVLRVKVPDAQIVGIMTDGDVAEDTSLTMLGNLVGIIGAGIVVAFLVTQVIDISSSLAVVLLVAYAALLSYGVFEWVRNPRA